MAGSQGLGLCRPNHKANGALAAQIEPMLYTYGFDKGEPKAHCVGHQSLHQKKSASLPSPHQRRTNAALFR